MSNASQEDRAFGGEKVKGTNVDRAANAKRVAAEAAVNSKRQCRCRGKKAADVEGSQK